MQENDPRPFGEVILNACLHDLNWDTQVEDGRSQYVWDLLQLSGNPAHYRAQILAALQTTPIGSDLDQLFELAHRFAAEGDEEARTAVYARFAASAAAGTPDQRVEGERTPVESGLDAGAEAIISLDALDGFLFVAEKLGERALADPSLWATDYYRDLAERLVGAEAARVTLERAREENKAIAAYLALVDEDRQGIASRRRQAKLSAPSNDVPKVQDEAAQGMSRRVQQLGKWAKPQDVERAARDLLAEQDPKRLREYLMIFGHFTFPFDPQPLITLAHDQDARTSRAALVALSKIQNPLVRQLALEMLAAPSRANSDMAVSLLASNYQPSDHTLIAQRLASEQDKATNVYHWLGMGALHAFEANPMPECAELLVSLYENGPCTNCRERCVDLLHRLGRLPDWMARECLFDANLDLREKARNYRSSSQE